MWSRPCLSSVSRGCYEEVELSIVSLSSVERERLNALLLSDQREKGAEPSNSGL